MKAGGGNRGGVCPSSHPHVAAPQEDQDEAVAALLSQSTGRHRRGIEAASRLPVEMGRKRWAVADGYIPGWSHGPEPEMTSHETICVLNTSHEHAHVSITVFFSEREPAGPYRVIVPPRRTRHIRLNDLTDPEPIPASTDFACVIDSSVPIVVQHTRLDSRQAENALISTIAHPLPD